MQPGACITRLTEACKGDLSQIVAERFWNTCVWKTKLACIAPASYKAYLEKRYVARIALHLRPSPGWAW
jgi:hypothetical protein